ncbi:MAG: hypothetical protein ACYDA4_09965 [Ignavibacteriaceae bacterium]
MEKKDLFWLIAAIAVTNAAGILLRIFNLDTFIILAGFRFHLSFFLPFIIFFRKSHLSTIKEAFVHPKYNKTFPQLVWILLPLVISLLLLYLNGHLEINDPDYFYEFGLSSIVDYPIYLIWNLPQLLLLASFLIIATQSNNEGYWKTSLIFVLLFSFEFIPVGRSKIDFLNLFVLLFAGVSAGLLIKYFQNIYWFAIIFFTLFWECLLAFGSASKMMINLLFAARYQAWDGFFIVAEKFSSYILAFHIFIATLLILSTVVIIKQNKA